MLGRGLRGQHAGPAARHGAAAGGGARDVTGELAHRAQGRGSDGRQHVTTQIQARPTLYRGIRMRSRLEADYAANLDRMGCQWTYEPECFASADCQWLPDFLVRFPDGTTPDMYIEVKPAEPLIQLEDRSIDYFNNVDDVLKRMGSAAWASEPNATLSLVFWQYGGPFYLVVYAIDMEAPWYALNGGPVEFLWPGMGQSKRLCQLRAQDAAEYRKQVSGAVPLQAGNGS
jgi:hypothetical protein